MKLEPLPMAGAFLVRPEPVADDRGSFARIWCEAELAAHGVTAHVAQASISTNARAGTLRGMHYSVAPHAEAKLVRCIRGAIYDVLLDLRVGSPTYLRWHAENLTADNGHACYIPEGVAHGFQTLSDDSHVLYMISEAYDPSCARGVRWDDPAFAITWPAATRILSERDRGYPDFKERA